MYQSWAHDILISFSGVEPRIEYFARRNGIIICNHRAERNLLSPTLPSPDFAIINLCSLPESPDLAVLSFAASPSGVGLSNPQFLQRFRTPYIQSTLDCESRRCRIVIPSFTLVSRGRGHRPPAVAFRERHLPRPTAGRVCISITIRVFMGK